ncbi:hypothetical protein ACFVQB_17700 [Paenibacillus sp. NPDC057886]
MIVEFFELMVEVADVRLFNSFQRKEMLRQDLNNQSIFWFLVSAPGIV